MGQINTTPGVDGENGGDQGTNYITGILNGEDDSRSSNLSADGVRDPLEAVQCVKTRIDMLIEDCLNVKEPNGDESNKEEKLVTNNSVASDQSPGKVRDCNDSDRAEVGCNDTNKQDDIVVDDHFNDNNDERSRKEITTGADKGDKGSGKRDEIRTPEKEFKVDENSGSEKKSETKKLKMADLIKEMDATEKAERQQNKTVTTFQTFIDKVLDSSLKRVPDQENGSSNILELCQESMQPNAESSKPNTKSSPIDPSKSKFDKSSTKIKPERKITLKDHIERFLEHSFREETGVSDKSSAEIIERKKEVGTKNGYENFNAQGLVNNMITQGLQINKLLTPPLVVNHSKNPQRQPDIHAVNDPSRLERQDGGKTQMKEMKTEHPMQNVLYKSEMGMMRNNGYQHSGPRGGGHGAHLPQHSPGQMNIPGGDSSKHIKDIRDNHHSRMSDEIGRDYHTGRHYPSDYNPESYQGQHHSVPPGFPLRMDHNPTVTTLDQQLHGGMIPLSYPSRPSAAAQYPHVAVPHPGVTEEQRSPMGRPSHHPPHCMCAICLSNARQTLDVRDPKKEYNSQRRSPNVPSYMVSHEHQLQMRSHYMDTSPAMMRPSHSKMPPCPSAAYQAMPKLLPQHPPITSTKEYATQLMVPHIGYPQGRRPSLPENSAQKPFSHLNRAAEFSHADQAEEYVRRMNALSRVSNHSPYPVRPSSMPSHEHSAVQDGGMFTRRSPAISESGSHSSEASVEAPLDLSVKKLKKEHERPRSSSYSSGAQHSQGHKKLNPTNTFLRHLENSVDKYCQELSGPAESPGKQVRQQLSRSLTPIENKQGMPYPAQSQRLPSPHNVYNLQHRKLPSPQFTGGITMGQPLVESRIQQSNPQRSPEGQFSNNPPQPVTQTSSLPAQSTSQAPVTTAQVNFDLNNKRNINSISKHEPIQNIIGNHDPNDILYLICTICTQTYGSPYGFRKHFRNQHGFEPRAEHTIVQTISATKTALHGPGPVHGGSPEFHSPQTMSPPAFKTEPKENSAINTHEVERKNSSMSPPNRKSPSEKSSETGDKNSSGMKNEKTAQDEISARRCLECPECGKTFQLNDFGSYKRHCRQHNTNKVTGSYTCSDCHLSFPDQKALKEHYIVHVNESHAAKSENCVSGESASPVKTTSSGNVFGCAKCEKQFDSLVAYNTHQQVHEQPPKLSPQISLSTGKETAAAHSTNSTAPTSSVLNVIPSQCIVKQAAESMTSQACPDSSWDDSDKSVPTPVDENEKQDENTMENSDSGYSSVGSNSLLNIDDKMNENFDKSPSDAVLRQKSLDSNSGSNEEQIASEDSFVYKHKKFSQHRKRESLSSHSSDSTPPKQAKIATTCQDRPPVSSSTTLCASFKCDSSETEDTKSVDKLKVSVSDNTDITTSKDSMLADKLVKEVNVGKAEARHNLPFVWDRTTRSQRKTK